MKVAAYSTGSPDYLIDIVTDGLIRLLGRASVHVRYNRITPPSTFFDHLFKDFGGDNAFPFEEADVLVASTRSDPNVILEWKRKTGKDKVAVLDGDDRETIFNFYLGASKVYFKREYLAGRSYPSNIRPLPFGAIPEDRPASASRDRKVSFQGNFTSEIRQLLWNVMNELGHPKAPRLLSKADYNKMLSETRIGVSARGIGWDTYRYWEVPYFGGMLISQRLGIVIPGNFEHLREAVFIDGPEDFRKKLAFYLEAPDIVEKIAAAGTKAVMERHLSTHRARTVLEAII